MTDTVTLNVRNLDPEVRRQLHLWRIELGLSMADIIKLLVEKEKQRGKA